jgi:hypothetical protein
MATPTTERWTPELEAAVNQRLAVLDAGNAFIAFAPSMVRALVAELERLRVRNQELEAQRENQFRDVLPELYARLAQQEAMLKLAHVELGRTTSPPGEHQPYAGHVVLGLDRIEGRLDRLWSEAVAREFAAWQTTQPTRKP